MALDQNVLDKTGVGSSLASVVPSLPQRQAEAWGKVRAGEQEGAALSADSKTTEEQRAKAIQPIEDKMLKAAQEPLPTVEEEKIPAFEKPKIKPEDLQSAFSTLLIASMLVGASSRTPYNNAMTAMTSAMDGYMKQDEAMTAEAMKEYDKNVNTIKANNESMRREMEDNWKKNEHNLKALDLEHTLMMARYDRHLAANSDAQKSISDRVKQGENEIKQTDTAVNKQLELSQQMQIHRKNLAQKREAAAAASAVLPGQQGLSGKEYLDTLPSGTAATVKAIAEGRETFSALGLRGAARTAMVNMVNQYAPAFQQGAYQNKNAVVKDFTSGAAAKNVTSINTAIGHMELLDRLNDALDTGNSQHINQAVNAIANALGKPEVNNQRIAAQAVGDELMRTFRQVGASESEANAWQAKFADANSKEKMKGATRTAAELLNSRINALDDQRKRGMGTEEGYPNLLSPHSKQVMSKFGMGQKEQIKSVASDEDYDALPSGSEFIDPKGVKRRKP